MAADFDHRQFLGSLSPRPGVYRMLSTGGEVLYVGKARNLRRRVASYYGARAVHPKVQALMAQTARVEVTITASEQEALLLEYNLIKAHRPRFNVLLRDDKSYPYIRVTTQQDFPRFEFHRGSRRVPGEFFGPFPNAAAVRETLNQIQKLFRVRQCSDNFFRNRSRPCLQHQIERCTAPCVGLIDQSTYREDVDDARLFLQGRNDAVLDNLAQRMEAAAAGLDYERAATYRDQITALNRIQAEQVITAPGVRDLDVLAAVVEPGGACVSLLVIRGGRVLGSRNFLPRVVAGTDPQEVLEAFMVQHYLAQAAPAEILIGASLAAKEVLASAFADHAGHAVRIRARPRGRSARWVEMAESNARQGLALHLAAAVNLRGQLEALSEALGLEAVPARIECFDISHTGGEKTVAACVVFGPDGPLKSDYRRFNLDDVPAGDDYAAIGRAVERRYLRLKKGEGALPDLVLIDGGRAQVDRARAVMEELQLPQVGLAGVAKGRDRRAGDERLHLPGRAQPVALPADSPALHLIQQIRDEAHRFALTGHRQRRSRASSASVLEGIPGLGPQRRRLLLRHFGGLQGVRSAGVADLRKVRGISTELAERIYGRFHDDNA